MKKFKLTVSIQVTLEPREDMTLMEQALVVLGQQIEGGDLDRDDMTLVELVEG